MLKVQPQYHQGIEYVKLSVLPFQQYKNFVSWISPFGIFNLKIEGEIVEDCVAYSDYEHWYRMNAKENYLEISYSI